MLLNLLFHLALKLYSFYYLKYSLKKMISAAMLSELMGEIWHINRVSLSHNHSPLQACKAARPCTKLK